MGGKTFDIIEHTADIGIIVHGSDMKELFANAALALFTLITEPERIEEKESYDIELTSLDMESLLVSWLNELLYVFEVEHMVFTRFDITSLSSTQLKARCYGEKLDLKRHTIKREVKAATYHMLSITSEHKWYKAQVIFDI
jgi:SHS2 domain-containing protein